MGGLAQAQEPLNETFVGVEMMGGGPFYREVASGLRLSAASGNRSDHIGGWDVEDRISGLTGSVDDYFAYGAYAGLVFRF